MYAPLYIKTNNSLLESIIKIEDLIDYALKNNINALTITDNRMFGVMEFYKACKKNNIKPIIGLEVSYDKKIVLYAMNNNGYKNLLKLATIQSEKSIIYDDLIKYRDGLLCIVPYNSLDEYNTLEKIYNDIYKAYSTKEEYEHIKESNKVYMNEILYINAKEKEYINYLYGIKDGKLVSDVKLSTKNNYIVSENILNKYFPEDIKNNYDIVSKCNVEISYTKNLLIKYNCPDNMDSYTYLKKLCIDGLKRIFNTSISIIYKDRLKHELEIINEMGFCDYFLVVYDYVKYAKENNIYIGPGRGSAAGSLVSYLLNITTIDPIKYNLIFERFLNPARSTMPDIDIDIQDDKRDQMINYCINKYGEKRVVPIIAFGTLASKQAIRDVGRTMDIDLNIIDYICKQIDSKSSLKDNIKSNNRLKEYIEMDEELKKLYDVAMKFEGLKRHVTVHAAGIIMSRVDIDEIVPLDKSHTNFYTTAYDMNYLEELGLLKMDFLALKNLTIIHQIIDDIGNGLTFDNIPNDDPKSLKIFTDVDTLGIFQFESEGMMNFLRKYKPTTFEDIFAAIALYRPGPMDSIDTYIARKQGKIKIDYYHESLVDILKPTYGVLIYQEQIMQVANVLAGYSLSEADVLRRAMSKKKEEILLKEKDKFVNNCVVRNVSKEIANKVYELILKFASFGFNRSHSVAYSMVAYKMAYLKAHYRIFFIKNILNNFISSEDKKKQYVYEARQNNIDVVVPDINNSLTRFEIINNKLIYPLTGIKGIGINACTIILDERKKGKFKDIYDFFKRIYSKSVNRKIIENLIYAGCFDSFNFNRNTLINNLDELINYSEISGGFDDEFNLKPELKIYPELSQRELLIHEYDIFGFYFTKHPVSEYSNNKYIKIKDMDKYFDKYINTVLLVERVKEVNTKNNDKMLFVTGCDEVSSIDIVMFPKIYSLYSDLKVGDVIELNGKVEKRFDKLQLVVSELKHLS